MISKQRRVCSAPYVPRHTSGIYRWYHRYRTLRRVRYHVSTGIGHFSKFGTTSMPLPDASVNSVRCGYLYRRCRYKLSYHFGNFGTASIPVPDTSVSSVRHPYRHRGCRYPTEHTLGIYHSVYNSNINPVNSINLRDGTPCCFRY